MVFTQLSKNSQNDLFYIFKHKHTQKLNIPIIVT